MRLSDEALKSRVFWEKAGISLPRFDRKAMIAATDAAPKWIHFGAGNIFRAFPVALAQSLLEQELETTGIIAAEGYDGEIIDKCFTAFDNLTILVTFKTNGTTEKKIIASVASSLRMNRDIEKLKELFASPSLQIASFTITEKGYTLTDKNGALLPEIAHDIEAGPGSSKSYLGGITALCHERFIRGAPDLALVSMDNCSHNGDKLFAAVETFAKRWTANGAAAAGFLDYVRDKNKLSFPWTMIDKITPRPDEAVSAMLASCGIQDTQPQVTEKNTYIAPFVNAEETQYLVIEDSFPNGRPALEKAGVLFTDRETVNRVEKMKVSACLNPLHTALAVFGCLFGYTRISEAMKDASLVKLVEGIGYTESLPVVTDPLVINPKEYIDEVIKTRLPNPFIPDTPQRIAADSSLKIPIRFGETIKVYINSGKNPAELEFIPLVFSGWLRYLLGIDDEGNRFNVSPDPNYESLNNALLGVKIGETGPFHDKLEPILSNPVFFGVNLYETGLGIKVEEGFTEMTAAPGAVRKVLVKTLEFSGNMD
ncbi:MAG: mannitol dehydrogenase family protein [Treponema sp.]|jgi:fructuronate reductase|nr:mannitol dehydrogenase family protein [Treponema sp.]